MRQGWFTRQNVGGPTSLVGGGLCWGDYNNDGFLDILVTYGPGTRNSLFRHNGNTNHWLKVKLDGRASNRSGIGAKVRVNATIGGRTFWQMRELSGQGSYGVDNGLIAHFGLGDATNVTTLRIEWPSGIVQELQNVATNQVLTVVEHQEGVTISPIMAASKSGDGKVQLSVTGQTNQLYAFEASTDLEQWTKIAVRTNLTGMVEFTPPTSSGLRQFYRVLLP